MNIQRIFLGLISQGDEFSVRIDYNTTKDVNQGTAALVIPAGVSYSRNTLPRGSYNTTSNTWEIGAVSASETTLSGLIYFKIDDDSLQHYSFTIRLDADDACDDFPSISHIIYDGVSCTEIQTCINDDIADLITLTGLPINSTDLGTFTGITITDNVSIKAALQEVETAIESITGATNLSYISSPINGTVISDTGTNATLSLVDATNAGLMIPADFTKLIGIELLADVTDATNVNAAGATMNSDTDLSSTSYFLDDDAFTANDATKVASQQSIKAYVDAAAGATDHGALTGLGDDDHLIYAFLAGRIGGQIQIGGTAASNDLTFRSTSNATKGNVIIEGPNFADEDDVTKIIDIVLSAITTGVTRTWTVPDRDLNFSSGGTFAESTHTHDASDTVSGTFADGRIAQTNVTQYQAALSITESQISDLTHTDSTAIHDNVAAEIFAIVEKVIPLSGDYLLIEDSAAGHIKKKTRVDGLLNGMGAASTILDNLTTTSINKSLNPGGDILLDLGTEALRWRDIYSQTIGTGQTLGDTFKIRAYDTDGAFYQDLLTVTAGITPTIDLFSGTTINSNPIVYSGGAFHDGFSDFVANEHIDWTGAAAGTVHTDNYIEGGAGTDTTAIHDNTASEISAITEKVAPINADWILIEDSAAANVKKKIQIGNIPGTTPGATTALSNLASVAINLSLVSDTDVTDDLGTEAIRWKDVYAQSIGTGQTAGDNIAIRAYDTDAPGFVDAFVITANNTVTADLSNFVTIGGNSIAFSGGAFHDGFSDFVANEHIDHTSVTLTAGVGITGGGTIAANRTFDLDVPGITNLAEAIASGDTLALYNISGTAHTEATITQLQTYMQNNLALITDHGGLTGLADDDHTQYLLADGTRIYSSQVITDNAIVTVDSATATSGEYARFTASGLESRTEAEFKADFNLEIGVDVQAFSAVLAATTASFLIADETKLDAIEALADVTDATNVNAAGATMNTDTTLVGNGYFLDEDTMSSDSATKVASQQSIKAYVDNNAEVGATTSVSGIVELATIAETNTGTDTTRAVTPDGLSGAIRTIILTAAGGSPTTTAGCSTPTQSESTTNKINYFSLDFDTTTSETAFWNIMMPDSYNGGTINATFVWTNQSGSAAQTVTWGIAARSFANSDAIDQAQGTEITTTDTFLAQGDVHISPISASITIGGGPVGGEWVTFEVTRKTATDNMSGDVQLLSVKIEYTINKYSD